MSERPALLGGTPVFGHKVNIVRPALPQFAELGDDVRAILESGSLTKGEHLRAFEAEAAEHLGVDHAVAVSSCTTGLLLTYLACDLKGEAVVPSFTFMATVSALVLAGVRPVFADVDRATMNLSPAAAEAALTPETTAIVAVHNFGNPAECDELQALADRRGLRLIFDAAQAFGSTYGGRAVGPQGDAQVFSLTPTKLLVAGEGGVVATNDEELAARVRVGREYGNDGSYDSAFAGVNARMPEFNALLARRGLPRVGEAAGRRNSAAEGYRARLGRLPGVGFQEVRDVGRSSYNYFTISVEPDAFGLTRDELAAALAAENVETRAYYDPPAHRQTAYRRFAPAANKLPATDALASSALSLPIWSEMDAALVPGVCAAVERAHVFAPQIRAKLAGGERGAARRAGEAAQAR